MLTKGTYLHGDSSGGARPLEQDGADEERPARWHDHRRRRRLGAARRGPRGHERLGVVRSAVASRAVGHDVEHEPPAGVDVGRAARGGEGGQQDGCPDDASGALHAIRFVYLELVTRARA